MRVLAAAALAALAALAACYAPDLAPCTVTCVPGGVACPAEFTCGADGYCHDTGDTASCTMTTTLSVTTSGTGGGTVVSSPAGVDCASGSDGTGCDAIVFAVGAMIQLAATPTGESTFAGWSGAPCTPTSALTCMLSLAQPSSVDAAFD